MAQTRSITLDKENTAAILKFIALVGVVSAAPLLGHLQFLSGPIVNAILFISVVLVGTPGAVFVGLLPSTIALSTGLLPAVLAPMIPFIMVGNGLMVVVFAYLREKNVWLAMIIASVVKFLFLFATSFVVVNMVSVSEAAKQASLMMSWPQLVTALIGGVIAVFVLNFLKAKTKK